MAQRVDVSFVDDLDGGDAEGTVTFALDGSTYEIDLSTQNLTRLRGILAPFVDAGRTTSGAVSASRGGPGTPSDRERNQAVREWALAQGLSVSTRGRISSEVLAAYAARNEAPVPQAPVSPDPTGQPRRKSTVQGPTFSSAPA